MKKILNFLILNLLLLKSYTSFALWNDFIKEWLINWQTDPIISWISDEKWSLSSLDKLINYIQNSLSSLILIIALWVFIYIWINLVIARWNPEEFKKRMMHFVYAAIWFFVIAAAYAAVRLVASLNI